MCYIGDMNKRDDILKAALGLFVEQGQQATSMKWIAKEAKCGIGTMYNYFPSKENLTNELYLKLKTKYIHFILKTLDTNKPIKQQFIDTWTKAVEFTIKYKVESKFLEKYSHSPIISEEVKAESMLLLSPVIEIFEKGKRDGIIKELDTMQLVIFVYSAITASIMNQCETKTEENAEAIILMAWDAIKS